MIPIFCKGSSPKINNVALGKHGRDRTNVWLYPGANKPGSSAAAALKDHPSPKNVEMCVDAILDVTAAGDIVLDPFLGSGTTLIAAEKSARSGYGIELDPAYADVCVRRWEHLTGKSAIHAETGRTFLETAADRATLGSEEVP
jgi:DNA modification methylase